MIKKKKKHRLRPKRNHQTWNVNLKKERKRKSRLEIQVRFFGLFFFVLRNCLRDYQEVGSVRSFHVQRQRAESVPCDAEGSGRTEVLPWKVLCVTTRLRMREAKRKEGWSPHRHTDTEPLWSSQSDLSAELRFHLHIMCRDALRVPDTLCLRLPALFEFSCFFSWSNEKG